MGATGPADAARTAGRGVVREVRTGTIVGGVQTPWTLAPIDHYGTDQETGCGVIYDSKQPFSAKRLRALYGNYAHYARRFEAAKAQLVRERWLLPEDAATLKPIATPADFKQDRLPAKR